MKMFEKKLEKKLEPNKFPKHIAFIIDGNGRWAKKRDQIRSYGHKFGVKACKNIVEDCLRLGIKYVSMYGFSTENWNRPQDELDALFNLFTEFVNTELEPALNKGLKFIVSGDYKAFPKSLVDAIEYALEKSKNNSEMVLNLCVNYGGRPEIVRAVNNIIKDGIKEVDEKTISNYLYTSEIPDPDFIVRTSGEQRLSNFMLWQMSYAELYFPKTFWPDFNTKELYKALITYSKRNRRFGAIKENKWKPEYLQQHISW